MKRKGNAGWYICLWLLLGAAVLMLRNPGKENPEIENFTVNAPVASSAEEKQYKEKNAKESEGKEIESRPEKKAEGKFLNGLWIPYYSLSADNEKAFKENFSNIAENAADNGMDALFVHVRAFGDAFYPSDFYPWSKVLKDKQGKNPDYDPLKFMVEETHKLGMEFHAWINPLRVSSGEGTPDKEYKEMMESNPYYFIETESCTCLNPAYSYVREMVKAGAVEIVEKYQVDGIHFDDYFYPSDVKSEDELAYMSYLDSTFTPLSVKEWRAANISAMVSETYRAVKRVNPQVAFGISPQGNDDNNIELGADIREWCSVPGYIDYICPQIYYGGDDFDSSLEYWKEMPRHDNLKFYVGVALYKACGKEPEWDNGKEVIKQQISCIKKAKADGCICFDSNSFQELYG